MQVLGSGGARAYGGGVGCCLCVCVVGGKKKGVLELGAGGMWLVKGTIKIQW